MIGYLRGDCKRVILFRNERQRSHDKGEVFAPSLRHCRVTP